MLSANIQTLFDSLWVWAHIIVPFEFLCNENFLYACLLSNIYLFRPCMIFSHKRRHSHFLMKSQLKHCKSSSLLPQDCATILSWYVLLSTPYATTDCSAVAKWSVLPPTQTIPLVLFHISRLILATSFLKQWTFIFHCRLMEGIPLKAEERF